MNANLYVQLHARFGADDKPCLILPDGGIWTYGDLDRASARLANLLVAQGLKPGDRVAAQIEKSAQGFALYLATLRAGMVFLPLNPAYRPDEVAYFLGDATPGLIVGQPGGAAIATAGHAIPCFELDDQGRGALVDAAASLDEHFDPVARAADDLAAILYTSGTTGRSKGAMLSHRNLTVNATTLCSLWGFSADDVLLHALPIFHVHGLFIASHCALLAGASMLWAPRFDAATVLAWLPEASVFMGVPTYYTRLLAEPGFDAAACRRMRLFISGSAPLLPETAQRFRERTGHTILERYGMTETGMLTSNPLHGERRIGSVGPALPGVALRIVAEGGEDGPVLAPGEIGTVEVKGENVCRGYWRMPEKSATDWTADGWFRTGDIGWLDTDAYLHLSGRAKDLIISGGLNVYPKEIELMLDELPGVLESAVIGLPHPDFGEEVVAVVVAEPEAHLDTDALLRTLKTRLAGYKVPKRIVIAQELPRNTMGKVQKNRLRETLSKRTGG